MIQIEQVENKAIIKDFDERLSVKDIKNILSKSVTVENSKNPFQCTVNNIKITLLVKQITYLGFPHLHFKKRIQITKGWGRLLNDVKTFLIGIYKYKDTCIYTYFDKTNFKNRVTNNSSAHVSSFDILKAQELGIFIKTDLRGNIITTIREDCFLEFLTKLSYDETPISKEITLFDNFKRNLNIQYNGIDCYQEMINAKYKNKFQAEWVGFYLEYIFEIFLNQNSKYLSVCNYQSLKKDNEIDLDLNFNEKYMGDLKTHSNNSGAILGNDKNNIIKALEQHSKIWYIVFSHDTIKDKDRDYLVTKFWNNAINESDKKKKKDIMSYAHKMKHQIQFTDYKILEINKFNYLYLTDFKQGKNSNGNERDAKIKIDSKLINNFLIHFSKF